MKVILSRLFCFITICYHSKLKFNAANVTEGIFFINIVTNAETKVTEVAQRTEGKLMFVIPDTLVAGTYYAGVRKSYTNAGSLEAMPLDKI